MLSRFFVNRPIFAWVIAITIMLAGVLAIFNLPCIQLSEITVCVGIRHIVRGPIQCAACAIAQLFCHCVWIDCRAGAEGFHHGKPCRGAADLGDRLAGAAQLHVGPARIGLLKADNGELYSRICGIPRELL